VWAKFDKRNFSAETTYTQTRVYFRGVWLAKNDFGLVFGSVLQKTGFRFGFGFIKLTVVLVFCTVCCLMCIC